jgi:hypothetical protein
MACYTPVFFGRGAGGNRERWHARLLKKIVKIILGLIPGIIVGAILVVLTAGVLISREVRVVNRWITILRCGLPGNSLLLRAACAEVLPAVNVPQEAVYWTTTKDGAGQKLSGQQDYIMPRLIYNNGFGKAILDKGFGEGPIPVNTLYTEPQTLFAQPLAAQSASSSNLMTTGVNRDTLQVAGWLDHRYSSRR